MDRKKLPEYSIPMELEKVLRNNLQIYDGMTKSAKLYHSILNRLKDIQSVKLSEGHYLQLLKLGLYLEEYQNNVEMRKHKIEKEQVERLGPKSNLFKIYVEGLDEEKPWIRPNDFVKITDTERDRVYVLTVTDIKLNEIIAADEDYNLKFCKNYVLTKLYDIKFVFSNYPLRCSHHALSLIFQHDVKTFLFPRSNKSYFNQRSVLYAEFNCYNPTMNSNKEQKLAIINIVNYSSYPAPYILYGPPGTGKTATLIEAICQIVYNQSTSNVLVCTPSNTAADLITKRLLAYVLPENIYRIYNKSKNGLSIDEDIQKCSNFEHGSIVDLDKNIVEKKRIVITTLCTSMRLVLINVREDNFSHVFIDEAGQATEPDILIPISLISKNNKLYSQVILSGDPKQLGPTVISKSAQCLLGTSILERIMSYTTYRKNGMNQYDPKYITMLINNYRSLPQIIQISNELFYDNHLVSKCTPKNSKNKFPILFHGTEGNEEKQSDSPSSYNQEELRVVLDYINKLIKNKMGIGKILPTDIGVVTPFSLQSKKLKKLLSRKNLNEIQVGTVDLFQGQEKEVIIITTVRTKIFTHNNVKHIGSLTEPKRFNVALTRAKSYLIVVGNSEILQFDHQWRYLLKFCIDNNAYRGLKFDLKELNEGEQKTLTLQDIVKSSTLFETPLRLFELVELAGETIGSRKSRYRNSQNNYTYYRPG